MRELWELMLWVAFFIFIAPMILAAGLVVAIFTLGIVPLALLGFGIWYLYHHKDQMPKLTKPYIPRPHKPWGITIHGQKVGIARLVLSIVISILIVLLLLLMILFVIPPIIPISIILIYIGYHMGKKGRR